MTLNGGIRPEFNRPGNEFGTFVSLNETHIFSPNKLNEFRANLTRVVGTSVFPPNAQVPSISITSVSGFSTNGYPSGYFQSNINYKDVFSWVHSSHTIKMGGNCAVSALIPLIRVTSSRVTPSRAYLPLPPTPPCRRRVWSIRAPASRP